MLTLIGCLPLFFSFYVYDHEVRIPSWCLVFSCLGGKFFIIILLSNQLVTMFQLMDLFDVCCVCLSL